MPKVIHNLKHSMCKVIGRIMQGNNSKLLGKNGIIQVVSDMNFGWRLKSPGICRCYFNNTLRTLNIRFVLFQRGTSKIYQ